MHTVDFGTPNVEFFVKNIQKTFGPGNRCFRGVRHFSLKDDELSIFISSLQSGEQERFLRSCSYFKNYMEPLHRIIEREGAEESGLIDSMAWSNFSLVIMFSIINYLSRVDRMNFLTFVKKDWSSPKSFKALKKLSHQHLELYPGDGKSIADFYNKFTEEKERREIEKLYDEALPFARIIEQIYREIRSPFVHGPSYKHISPLSAKVKLSNNGDLLGFDPVLLIDDFLEISWLCVFRYFNYKGQI